MALKGYELWKRRMANRVQRLLKAKGLSAFDLAMKSGMPPSYLMKVVAAETYPTFKVRQAIAPHLGVTEKELGRF